MPQAFQISLAPDQLWQAINPWTVNQQGVRFGLINIDLGQTPRPDIEQRVLDEVGSYGRQLGRIGDALEVLMDHMKTKHLSREDHEALDALKAQLVAVRQIKTRTPAPGMP